ncbi:MAG: hypothetical protein OEW52_12615 [Thermoleophilia bacterium]|nr:hypothetical protein [Thermoleophilia bacterium]MDH5281968.1 hypothetical protein [Thermoleophilia bacterium]
MATISENPESTGRGWSERWSPLGGLGFVIGIIALLVFNPDSGETPADVIKAADDKHDLFVAMAIFGLVSIPLLLWFVSGLHARVRRLQSETAPALVLAGGTAFALLFFIAFEIFAAPFTDFPGKADPTLAANTYLTIDDIGWVILGGAGVAFALMAIAASIAALKSRTVPTWLGWLGAIVGLAAAATVMFFGIFAWIAWILVASILLLVRRA